MFSFTIHSDEVKGAVTQLTAIPSLHETEWRTSPHRSTSDERAKLKALYHVISEATINAANGRDESCETMDE